MENMNSEIIDAVIEYFDDKKEDSKDLIRNCLIWMKENSKNITMADRINKWFYENDYCKYCGSEMNEIHIEEIHTEILGNPVEKLIEVYCPKCDR